MWNTSQYRINRFFKKYDGECLPGGANYMETTIFKFKNTDKNIYLEIG